MNTCRKGMRVTRVFFVLLLSLLAACGSAPAVSVLEVATKPESALPAETVSAAVTATTESTEEPAAAPLLMPGEPPESERILEDTDSSIRAYEKRALTGDNILKNLYERPFTAEEMVYLPDVDIQTAEIANDETFFYFTITLKDVDTSTGTLTGTYGIEFDRTKTGRGDLLVMASAPQPEWSTGNLSVYADTNGDVGGIKPILAEAGFAGDGYETAIALKGDRVAYARIDPEDTAVIQIAVSRALLEDTEEFLWGAWADKVVKDPTKFNYNDAFGPNEAGSPLKLSGDYPLKALHSLDNTCRLPYGFGATGRIPGMCISIPKVEKEKGKPGEPAVIPDSVLPGT